MRGLKIYKIFIVHPLSVQGALEIRTYLFLKEIAHYYTKYSPKFVSQKVMHCCCELRIVFNVLKLVGYYIYHHQFEH